MRRLLGLHATWIVVAIAVGCDESSGRLSTLPWARHLTLTSPSTGRLAPGRNSVSVLQSITIVGTERTSNRAETEVLRTELAIRFRNR